MIIRLNRIGMGRLGCLFLAVSVLLGIVVAQMVDNYRTEKQVKFQYGRLIISGVGNFPSLKRNGTNFIVVPAYNP